MAKPLRFQSVAGVFEEYLIPSDMLPTAKAIIEYSTGKWGYRTPMQTVMKGRPEWLWDGVEWVSEQHGPDYDPEYYKMCMARPAREWVESVADYEERTAEKQLMRGHHELHGIWFVTPAHWRPDAWSDVTNPTTDGFRYPNGIQVYSWDGMQPVEIISYAELFTGTDWSTLGGQDG
jgi:hypothetical protein